MPKYVIGAESRQSHLINILEFLLQLVSFFAAPQASTISTIPDRQSIKMCHWLWTFILESVS